MSWAAQEFETIDLGDKRLNRRAVLLAERLAASPTVSIPAACGGWTETQGAYRLLGNDDIGWEDILAPHLACTEQRMAAHSVVLCIQDTTELDFNGQQSEAHQDQRPFDLRRFHSLFSFVAAGRAHAVSHRRVLDDIIMGFCSDGTVG